MVVSIVKAVYAAKQQLDAWGASLVGERLEQVLMAFQQLAATAQDEGLIEEFASAMKDVGLQIAGDLIEAQVREVAKSFAIDLNRFADPRQTHLVAGEFGRSVGKIAGTVAFNVLTSIPTGGGAATFNTARRGVLTALGEAGDLARTVAKGTPDSLKTIGGKLMHVKESLRGSFGAMKQRGSARLKTFVEDFEKQLQELIDIFDWSPEPAVAGGGRMGDLLPDARRDGLDVSAFGERTLEKQLADEGLDMEGTRVAAVHVTTPYRAGAARPPRHHILPQERRSWFEERGCVGNRDIDNFTIELSEPEHQALHGGGDHKLARNEWLEGEWNSRVFAELDELEEGLGRQLTFEEIMDVVDYLRVEFGITHHAYLKYRGTP